MRLNWTEVKNKAVMVGLLVPVYFAAMGIRNQGYANEKKEGLEAEVECVISEKKENRLEVKRDGNKEEEEKVNKQEESLKYNAIKQVLIRDFLADYLDEVTPQSTNFKKLRKRYGREGVLERYVSAHELYFDLAFNNQGKEISDKQYEELGLQLAKKQGEVSKGISPVNNLDKRVIKVYEEWGRNKTGLFIKLFEASNKIKPEKLETEEDKKDYVKILLNSVFSNSREEYTRYIENSNRISDDLYDAMRGTLGPIERLLFEGGQFGRIAKCTREIHIATIDYYFPKLNLNSAD